MTVADTFSTSLSLMQVVSFAFFVMFVVGVAATACAFVYSLAIELVEKRRTRNQGAEEIRAVKPREFLA